MTIRVSGMLDDTLYEVEVTGDASNPVVGSKRVAALVAQHTGATVLVTPHGPAYTVNPGDEKSVLALLSTETKVASVGAMGQTVPPLVEPLPPATIR